MKYMPNLNANPGMLGFGQVAEAADIACHGRYECPF
jgi:hypothetical protein